jgi:galactokinase
MIVTSTVPSGAGLSSSAALEMAVGFALLDSAGLTIDRTALALACQQAEHEFAGTRCGLMDQYIVAHGSAGRALLLDTRSLQPQWLPMPAEVAVVVSNTMTKHALATAGYNQRRADCEAGVAILAATLPGVRALRDVTPADLETCRPTLPERIYRRCRHVVEENARVQAAAGALEQGDLEAFGQLMLASHRSLREDYEVSTKELDLMVEIAGELPGVYGSRMTGGGFGGCAISLVRAGEVPRLLDHVKSRYAAMTGQTPEVYPCLPSQGVHRWNA